MLGCPIRPLLKESIDCGLVAGLLKSQNFLQQRLDRRHVTIVVGRELRLGRIGSQQSLIEKPIELHQLHPIPEADATQTEGASNAAARDSRTSLSRMFVVMRADFSNS